MHGPLGVKSNNLLNAESSMTKTTCMWKDQMVNQFKEGPFFEGLTLKFNVI